MSLSLFFTICSWLIGALVLVYSAVFMRKKKNNLLFFLCAFLTLICATGAFLADNFVVFLAFWGSLLVLLYAMLALDSFKTATKSLIIVGIGDFSLILGVAYLMALTGKTAMSQLTPLPTNDIFTISAFLLIAFGAMIKAGIFGFHQWIVEAAQTSPSVTLAFLPASLDKFLGIYLLVRAFKDFFIVSEALSVIVMSIGAITVLLAVLMALAQHDLKKLLAFHAVSQVGYMILGIASGTAIGLAGGVFHMLNNTIYKSGLFISSGNIEYRVGKTELSLLGGLGKLMPVTFLGTIIASFAISGIPPFNGFASKWMVYQGLIPQQASSIGIAKIVFLIIAMFGSVLTLASFMKVLYSAFMESRPKDLPDKIREAPWLMRLPLIILSLLCIFLGIFANQLIVKPFLEPILGSKIDYLGVWEPNAATILIVLSLLAGAALYLLSKANFRATDNFYGGEVIENNKVLGTDFYLSVQELKPLKMFYGLAQAGSLDLSRHIKNFINISSYILFYGVDRLINFITDGLGKLVFVVSAGFKNIHSGLLDRYSAWLLLGFLVLLGVLTRCLIYM